MTEALSPILETKESYFQRYDNTSDATIEAREAEYPDFPGIDDVRARIVNETDVELATKTPDHWVYSATKWVPSDVLRTSFSGTDQELTDFQWAGYGKGLQVTDQRLHLPEEVRTQLVSEAKEATIDDLATYVNNKDLWWANKDTKVAQDIEEGRLNEWFELRKGDHAVRILNCDRPMTDAEVEEIRSVIDRLAVVSEDKIFGRLKTIVLQHDDRFNRMGENLVEAGKAYSREKLFRANTAYRDLAHLIDPGKEVSGAVPGWTHFQNTLAHELGHLLDVNVPMLDDSDTAGWERLNELETGHPPIEGDFEFAQASAFGPQLGWTTKEYAFTDSEGVEQKHQVRGIRGPSEEMWLLDDQGCEHKVKTLGHFTVEEVENDLPMSEYGNSNAREDFGEAIKFYALAGPDSIGPVRRAIIRHTIAKLITTEPIECDPNTPVGAIKRPLKELDVSYKVPERREFAIFIEAAKGWRKAPDWMPWIPKLRQKKVTIANVRFGKNSRITLFT